MKLKSNYLLLHYVQPDKYGHYPESYAKHLIARGLATEAVDQRQHSQKSKKGRR